MLKQLRPQPGRTERPFAGGVPSVPAFNVEADRAPITFGWWLYAQDRFVGNCHLETLYRLDRVGARLGDHGLATLQPSVYYGQSTEKLREMLRVRAVSLLPRAPEGHRWIGPQVVQEVPCTVLHTAIGAGKVHTGELPRHAKARLEFAHVLACRILGERVPA